MSKDIIIELYNEKYKEQLIKLFDDFGDYLVDIDNLKRLRRMQGYGKYFINSTLDDINKKEGVLYVALDREKVVGFSVGIIIRQTEEDLLRTIPSISGRITELYIDSNYRGKELGRKLINRVESYLKEKGCDAIFIEVFAPNKNAYDFYKKLGYTDRDFVLIKRI